MKGNLFQNLTPDERVQALKDNAWLIESQDIRHNYTEPELEEMRKNLANEDIDIDTLEDKKKEVTAEINGKLKGKKSVRKSLVKNLRKGYVMENQEVYGIDNQEAGMMEFYNSEGEFLHSRKLFREEKQTRLKLKQTA